MNMVTEEEGMEIELETSGTELPEDWKNLIRETMHAALRSEGRSGGVTILVTTPEEIRRLNREFRIVDSVTDVLTFPACEGDNPFSSADGYLGDVAICLERALEQAEAYGHSPERELGFLTVHGALHLLGYDHMNEQDEKRMFSRQEEILNGLHLFRADPAGAAGAQPEQEDGNG